jgi:hypothetical protein
MGQNYPIGIQTFSKLIASKAIYVDKTHFLFPLLESDARAFYFPSRPR